jgi:hypothetical protein
MSIALQILGGLLTIAGVRGITVADRSDMHYIIYGAILLSGVQFIAEAVVMRKAGKNSANILSRLHK